MPVSIRPGQIALTLMPVPDKLLGSGGDEVDDPRLGRRIGRPAGTRAQPGDAGGADDRAAAARFQVRRGVLDGEERPDQVDPQNLRPILGGLFEDRGEAAGDAGVGEDDVEAAMLRDRVVDQPLDIGFAASVGLDDAVAPVLMSLPTTVAPSLRNSSAAARPMPDAAPVTIATLPLRRPVAMLIPQFELRLL